MGVHGVLSKTYFLDDLDMRSCCEWSACLCHGCGLALDIEPAKGESQALRG